MYKIIIILCHCYCIKYTDFHVILITVCVFIECGLQVQMGTHSFTFDHVYGGSNGSPSSLMFNECVAPLVHGLFHGYNATVLAYGQV